MIWGLPVTTRRREIAKKLGTSDGRFQYSDCFPFTALYVVNGLSCTVNPTCRSRQRKERLFMKMKTVALGRSHRWVFFARSGALRSPVERLVQEAKHKS